MTSTEMKALLCMQPGKLEYQTLPVPQPVDGELLIRISRIGICGTDLHAFEGTQPYFNYPRRLGHELSGYIEAGTAGDDMHTKDPVTIIPYLECGECIACRNGRPNCCTKLVVLGVHADGGMCEYLSVPASHVIRNSGLNEDQLALIEPLAIGAHAVARAQTKEADQVLIIGAGPIGLGIMLQCKLAGAVVIAMDINEERLRQSASLSKADFLLDARDAHCKDKLREITRGDMALAVFDATGSLSAINGGLDYLAHGGSYVLVGLQKQPFQFSHPEFHRRESTLMSSRNALRSDFLRVIEHVRTGALDPLSLVTHRLQFEDLAESFSNLLSPDEKVIKALVNV